jgi:hypothetical protein
LQTYEDYLTQELGGHRHRPARHLCTTTCSYLSAPTVSGDPLRQGVQPVRGTFSVAKTLTAALPLFAAKQITDGKAQVSRFDNPYKDAIKSINEQYETLKARLIAALGAIGTTTTAATVRRYMAVVSPSVDPVTGL